MSVVKQEVLKAGPLLQRAHQLTMIRGFTKKDIVTALKSIDDNKAPEGDGFSSLFYKQAWPIIGEEVI